MYIYTWLILILIPRKYRYDRVVLNPTPWDFLSLLVFFSLLNLDVSAPLSIASDLNCQFAWAPSKVDWDLAQHLIAILPSGFDRDKDPTSNMCSRRAEQLRCPRLAIVMVMRQVFKREFESHVVITLCTRAERQQCLGRFRKGIISGAKSRKSLAKRRLSSTPSRTWNFPRFQGSVALSRGLEIAFWRLNWIETLVSVILSIVCN